VALLEGFQRLDFDGNGYISHEEFTEAMRGLCPKARLSGDEIHELLTHLDANKVTLPPRHASSSLSLCLELPCPVSISPFLRSPSFESI